MREANPESLLIYLELLSNVSRICHAMNPVYRHVLHRIYYDEYDTKEIARRNHTSNYEVVRVHDVAIRQIREKLFEAGILEKHRMNQFRTVKRMRLDLNRSEFYEPNA
jgi:DNA-directed RNA polymerase specialized sigma subunit